MRACVVSVRASARACVRVCMCVGGGMCYVHVNACLRVFMFVFVFPCIYVCVFVSVRAYVMFDVILKLHACM